MGVKLQFRDQEFQKDAAKAVCEVFSGQQFKQAMYHITTFEQQLTINDEYTVWGNGGIDLDDEIILENLRRVQRNNFLSESESLDGKYNLTIEMETGTGKTFTYIKTIYELNKLYGWSKFIIVVPSIAIREGVNKTFQTVTDYFHEEYKKYVEYFIYDSANLSQINRFVSDNKISAMIINSQAFNARGEDARRIRMELDEFRSRKPLDVIASVRPIMIIDEPQSVEGAKTKESLKDFNPLFTLRYSATPREKYNLVYRLTAVDAYRKKLVKKIQVTGFTVSSTSASGGYVYLKGIQKSQGDPAALIEFDMRTSNGLSKITRSLKEGADLYEKSGELAEYREGFQIRTIDGLNRTVEFVSGKKLNEGEIIGAENEEQIRRLQIRETIDQHLQKEQQLYERGIKVLSLFFIDEVARYRQYDINNNPVKGTYAKIFEEEYTKAIAELKPVNEKYLRYIEGISAEETHAGYFSIDKNNRMTDSRVSDKKEQTSDDISAFDLIMRDKERLLSRDEHVRFIFSHSALREGWDNPNIFQICTLKNSTSDIRRRQEVGRGLRLSVNENGERMDEESIGTEVHDVNELTVIASESYKDFAEGLQQEISETSGEAARLVPIGNTRDERRMLTLNRAKFNSPEFESLWNKINRRSVYVVDINEEEFVRQTARDINEGLDISPGLITITTGTLDEDGGNFTVLKETRRIANNVNSTVQYDLIGTLTNASGLTRKIIVKILKSVDPKKFKLFAMNPEIFTSYAAQIIINRKAEAAAHNISYNALNDNRISREIFTEQTLHKCPQESLVPTPKRGLYDYAVCDSKNERRFVTEMDICEDVAFHMKLPGGFTIQTPVGRYNPDWGIALTHGREIIAETKGTTNPNQLRIIEKAKTDCARAHFRALDSEIIYKITDSFDRLMSSTTLKQ